jgi:hypothetical protein
VQENKSESVGPDQEQCFVRSCGLYDVSSEYRFGWSVEGPAMELDALTPACFCLTKKPLAYYHRLDGPVQA